MTIAIPITITTHPLFLFLLFAPLSIHGSYITYIKEDFYSRQIYNFPFNQSPTIGASFKPRATYNSCLVMLPKTMKSLCNGTIDGEDEDDQQKLFDDGSVGGGRRTTETTTMRDKWDHNNYNHQTNGTPVIDTRSLHYHYKRNHNPNNLALLAHAGKCSIVSQAMRAIELDERVEFLILIASSPDYEDAFSNDKVLPEDDPLNYLRIAYITPSAGHELQRLFSEHIEMHPTVTSQRNSSLVHPFRPFVIFFGDDKVHQTSLWKEIIYILILIVVIVPAVWFRLRVLGRNGGRWGWGGNSNEGRGDERGEQGDRWDSYDESLRERLRNVWREGVERSFMSRMTEEDVQRLPKIEYGLSNIEEVGNRYDCNTVEKMNHNRKNDDDDSGDDGSSCSSSNISNGVKNPQPSSFSTKQGTPFFQNAYASHTNCSICVEEFFRGETLVLLPQCGHFFHSACITPWLTEKKGTCPLCQTVVLPSLSSRMSWTPRVGSGGMRNGLREGEEQGETVDVTMVNMGDRSGNGARDRSRNRRTESLNVVDGDSSGDRTTNL